MAAAAEPNAREATSAPPDAASLRFARACRRFYRVAAGLARVTPASADRWLAPMLGRRLSPYRPQAEAIRGAMRAALGLGDRAAEHAWQRWLASSGWFGLTAWRYGQWSPGWLASHVSVDDPQLLRRLAEGGGLVLTYHTHHQNTLAAALGLAGCPISPLAESPSASPLHPHIGDIVEHINAESARHFRGGGYLFTDRKHQLVRETWRLLAGGKVVLSLCDFARPGAACGDPGAPLLGRVIRPPLGAIEIALRERVPIVAAVMLPEGDRYRLRLQPLASDGGVVRVLQQYGGYLEALVREQPWAWQGWDWYLALPVAEAASSKPIPESPCSNT